MRRALIGLILLTTACTDPWYAEHEERCAGWLQKATTRAEQLQVNMKCAEMRYAHDNAQAIATAAIVAGAMASSK